MVAAAGQRDCQWIGVIDADDSVADPGYAVVTGNAAAAIFAAIVDRELAVNMRYRTPLALLGHGLYHLCNMCVALYSSYSWALANGLHDAMQHHYLGLLLVALTPLANALVPFDSAIPSATGIRLPRVSSVLMLGSVWMLLGVPVMGMVLWLWLLCVGGFFITTYSLSDA